MAGLSLVHPASGRPLRPEGPHVLTDGATRVPAPLGIPYLRPGREGLAAEALTALDTQDVDEALVLLLADQDDNAPVPPPPADDIRALLRDPRATYREAMEALRFGPVATYFAHRQSAPTFLSGLALVAAHRAPGEPLVELACGCGHLLRAASAAGIACAGVDLVFAKLWLGRRYLLPPSTLLACADIAGPPVAVASGPAAALCHDALYFIPDRAAVVAALRSIAGPDGVALAGHLHLAGWDHGGVAGARLEAAEWLGLMPGAALYEDAALAATLVDGTPPEPVAPEALAGREAASLASRPARAAPDLALALPPVEAPLRLNPLLAEGRPGRLSPHWPSPAFAREYANADYLDAATPPPERLEAARLGHRDDPMLARLARRRVLVDLPEAW